MTELRYLAPDTLDEAIGAFAKAGSAARILAGGTDLLVQMRSGALKPGVIDHIAFSARGLTATLAKLAAHNVEHICRQQVSSGVWQVFFFDPNGARVELDFAAEESATG